MNEHPEYYVSGTSEDLARAPQNYIRVKCNRGELILAHGRDPYFPGWPDTLQLDYSNTDTQAAMMNELVKVAGQCDAVRCDMGMLILPDVFARTWGKTCQPFWSRATEQVHKSFPEFRFVAEVYWDLEWTLQQKGFDYTYDKRLYDRLRDGHARPVREHFQRTGLRDFSKTTTNRERLPHSHFKSIKPPQSLPFCLPDSDSSTKDNSKGESNAFLRIWFEGPMNA